MKRERMFFRKNYRASQLALFFIGSISIMLAVFFDMLSIINNRTLFYMSMITLIIELISFLLGITKKISIFFSLAIIVYTAILSTLIWDFLIMYSGADFFQYFVRDLFVLVALMLLCAVTVNRIHAMIITGIISIFTIVISIVSKEAFLLKTFPLIVIIIIAIGFGLNYFIMLLEKSSYEIHCTAEKMEEKNRELERINKELQDQRTELLETQSQLIQAEKMATLGQLISGIAHEINTPLGAIKASINNISFYITSTLEEKMPVIYKTLNEKELTLFFTLLHKSMENTLTISSKEKRAYKKLLIEQLEEAKIKDSDSIADTFVDMGIYDTIEPYYELLRNQNSELILQTCYEISGIVRNSVNINIAVERAGKIIFALKNYSHNNSTTKKVEADIIEGIETVLSLYHHNIKQGTEVIRKYKEIPKIMCFPDELNQVWTNIIHNALQAMDNKGIIEITIYQKDNFVYIEIANNGSPIPKEIQDKIFDPFFTTKRQGEGTGIGLNIVRKIVEKHDGEISVESTKERTTFTIWLPIEIA